MDLGSGNDRTAAWPRFDDVALRILRRNEGAYASSRTIGRDGWRRWLAEHGTTRPLPDASSPSASADRAAG